MATLPERLRDETRPLHEQTEALFYTDNLQNGTLTAEQYRHLLRTHLLFHRALEAVIDRYPDFFAEYDRDARRKTPWLLHDLSQLREPIPPVDVNPFADWTPEELLGAAYVAEGSMLGGSVIGRMLQKSPEVQSLLPDAQFFGGYGPSLGSRWKQFVAFLTAKGEANPDTVVDAARAAFADYQHLFRQAAPVMN